MQAVLLQNGSVVAWLQDSELFATDGQAIGFVRGRGVFSPVGDLIGYYQNSAFRSTVGKVVATLGLATMGERPPVCIARSGPLALTDWPPLVPSLDQWSTEWRNLFAPRVAVGAK